MWKISGLYYIYLPVNDDAIISTCIKLSRSGSVTAILPRRYERLKRQLLTRMLGRRSPNIWPFDAFISYRTLMASIDQGWHPEKAVLDLLVAYNRRITDDGASSTMLVQVPE